MSIITNLGTYNIVSEIPKNYEKITYLKITNKEIITEFSNIIKQFINLKKVDISTIMMYDYMKQFLLFDYEICEELYNYMFDTKNILNDNFDEKKAEFMLRTRNLKIDKSKDIIEQMKIKNQEIKNIKQFYKNLVKLEIEYLKIDYFIPQFFTFTSLIYFELCNCNYYLYFQDNINVFILQNKNIKKFILNKYDNKIISEEAFFINLVDIPYYMYFTETDFVYNYDNIKDMEDSCEIVYFDDYTWNYFVERYKDNYIEDCSSSRKMECKRCVMTYLENKVELLKNPEKYKINKYYYDHFEIKWINLKFMIDNKIEELSYYNDNKFMCYKNTNNTIYINNGAWNCNLLVDYLPSDLEYLNINSNCDVNFVDNLPLILYKIELKMNHFNSNTNLNDLKIPFNCKVKITKRK